LKSTACALAAGIARTEMFDSAMVKWRGTKDSNFCHPAFWIVTTTINEAWRFRVQI
jgi:hypothetical protein